MVRYNNLMYIVHRNQEERAAHSSFEDEILGEGAASKALWALIPFAAVGLFLLAWALVAGASPLALVLVVVFLSALLAK